MLAGVAKAAGSVSNVGTDDDDDVELGVAGTAVAAAVANAAGIGNTAGIGAGGLGGKPPM